MALDWLNEWVQGYCEATGRSFRAVDGARGVLLDADAVSLVAIEWEADAHTLHVYGHPGYVSRPVRGEAQEVSEDDDDDDDDGQGAGEAYPASIDLSANDTERRTLQVEPKTGLVTLSLVVPFASLDVPTFQAAIDDFIADMDLWSKVFAGEAPVPGVDVASHGTGPGGGSCGMPPGAIVG